MAFDVDILASVESGKNVINFPILAAEDEFSIVSIDVRENYTTRRKFPFLALAKIALISKHTNERSENCISMYSHRKKASHFLLHIKTK